MPVINSRDREQGPQELRLIAQVFASDPEHLALPDHLYRFSFLERNSAQSLPFSVDVEHGPEFAPFMRFVKEVAEKRSS